MRAMPAKRSARAAAGHRGPFGSTEVLSERPLPEQGRPTPHSFQYSSQVQIRKSRFDGSDRSIDQPTCDSAPSHRMPGRLPPRGPPLGGRRGTTESRIAANPGAPDARNVALSRQGLPSLAGPATGRGGGPAARGLRAAGSNAGRPRAPRSACRPSRTFPSAASRATGAGRAGLAARSARTPRRRGTALRGVSRSG